MKGILMMAKKLDKVMAIGDENYEVQAKTAEKVENPLIIRSIGLSGSEKVSEQVEFFGNAKKEISIVSAETGGRFKAPIAVKPLVNGVTPNSDQVLGYSDIKKVVANMTGSGWYLWSGSGSADDFTVVKKNEVNQHLGIVIGPDGQALHEQIQGIGFSYTNYHEGYLPMYLYICSDTGNLYYGTSEDTICKQIVNEAIKLVSTSKPDETCYTADSLAEIITRLESKITNIINGSQTVGKAENADYVEHATSASSATNDSDNKPINKNYYRATYNTVGVNSITISTTSPTANDGIDGDIWIVY